MAGRVAAGVLLTLSLAVAGCAGHGGDDGHLASWCRTMAGIREATDAEGRPLTGEDDEALIAVAPSAIREDLEVVAELRARHGEAAQSTPQFESRLDRLFRYEHLHCRTDSEAPAVDLDRRAALLAAVEAAADEPDIAPALQAVLDAAIAYLGIDGASVTVIGAEGQRWSAHSGATRDGRPITETTRFHFASIGKTYVAATALRLAERGVVELDAPVGLPGVHPRATLRHLLSHTAGLPDLLLVPGGGRWTEGELAEAIAAFRPLCDPGRCHAYSDVNFIAAALALERITGQRYEQLEASEVLEPSGSRDVMQVLVGQTEERLAEPIWPAGARVPLRAGMPAMIGTSTDLARFGHALFGGGLLNEGALAEMREIRPSLELPCPTGNCIRAPNGYGLGLTRYGDLGHESWGHGGSSGAVLRYFPERRVTVAVLTTTPGSETRLLGAVVQAIPGVRLE